MHRLFRSALWLCAAVFLALGFSVADAADRNITLIPGNDLPGFDYSVVKGVTIDACKQACTGDNLCRAFTYNGKAKWCFLKGNAGTPTPFAAAISGKVTNSPSVEDVAKARQAELPFPAQDLIDAAAAYTAALPKTNPPPPGTTYQALVAAGDAAEAATNPDGALLSFKQALAILPNDPAVWMKLATIALARADQANAADDNNADLDAASISAVLNGFLLMNSAADRANALGVLGHALERHQMYREAIATYRASIGLVDDAKLQARLDATVAQHGFHMVSNATDAEAATPRICVVFSSPPATGDMSSYVVVDNAPKVSIDTEDSQICITGVDYGQRYHVKLRAGLASADGETLGKDIELNAFVPDRKPFVGFANKAYVLPAGLGGGLPISSVNAKTADLTVYRIGDRSIATAVRDGIFQGTLDTSSAEAVASTSGQKLWTGQVDLTQGKPNEQTTTAIPIADVVKTIEPGAYVITARVTGPKGNADDYSELATQWFIVTDLGLSTVSGDDGIHAFVRSLTTAQPVAKAKVRLIARNNEVLGETTSDADGRADFAPGLSRGDGGRAPQLLVAETDAGDYAFLDQSKTAFDLTDRGVDGRASPGPLDLYATTERGVYRPGETVFLTALLRDAHAKAVAGLPLTMDVERPDGVVAVHKVLSDKGSGGYFEAVPLIAEAMRGSWNIKLYADPKAEALSTTNFLVEDFEPERLAFDVSAPNGAVKTEAPTDITVAAKYLYGATAPGLAIQADTVLSPVSTIDAFPGYTFGRADDTTQPDREELGNVGTTDDSGNATAEVTLPKPAATTRPLQAQIIMSLIDANGRSIQRSLTRPVMADVDRIGIRPAFDKNGGLAQNSSASFNVIAVAPTGETIDKPGLTWSLSRVDTNYQWYRDGSTWKWEAVTTNRQVANGTIDAKATGPVNVTGAVDWGSYVLEVNSTGDGATSSSYTFYAGYFEPPAGSDTPDTLKVALDKKSYHTGETAHLKLDPQFAGTALVMVVDDRLVSMQAVDVPAAGLTVDLPVTDKWGPGAYVTAALYRPASAAEKRMPARALGVAFADVDPGDLKLNVSLDTPKEAKPRQPMTIKVKLGNVAAGQKAYIAIAAVDLGILNLTNFKIPDPDGWYFGQRQLGVELRDLYGQLIDPTQGLPGAVRSGGDGEAPRLGTPPATSVLVALDSGVVTVGPDGTATVTFDMPDFNGTARLMAMAWSDGAVGHSSIDVVVHDPVVVNLSPPRFLRVGDKSRLLVEVNNISGAPGTYHVALTGDKGVTTDAADTSFDLAVGARKSLDLGLTGTIVGDQRLKLLVTAPNGDALSKQLTLGVRATSAPQTTATLIPLAQGEAVTLDASRFAGMLPNSSSLTLAIGPIARLDVPQLLLELDRYPYGCAEQVSSRALPLLYLNDVAKMIGIGTDDALKQRVKDAITDLLSKQTSSGAFGLWGPNDNDAPDLYLDAYVTDFLLRARDKGYDVPVQAMNQALDNLGNQVSSAQDFTNAGEGLAYALYDLARGGRAAIGDLRYYFEARLTNFGSPLAQAQLGAALALYGDRTRAASAFAVAVAGTKFKDDPHRYRIDYGSQLRDTAGVLALAAEFTPAGVDIGQLTRQLADLRAVAKYTSTQEDAWTLVAASALAKQTANGSVTIDGKALTGSVYQRYNQEHFDTAPVIIANNGNEPTEMKISVTGIPATPPAATGQGFTIARDYFHLDGTAFNPTSEKIAQNDRFVVVLSLRSIGLGSGQYMVADPLPAGFEIENSDLNANSGVGDFSWLKVDTPSHVEARTDQYVAAFRYETETGAFSTAYIVRAVSPGSFTLPGATVEDMYQPEQRANSDAARIEVKKTGP